MPLIKVGELRQLSKDELQERLEKLNKEYFDLIQKREVGQLDRPHRFGQLRRERAQIMTLMGEK
jgi:large subunit ribosomal protein L29